MSTPRYSLIFISLALLLGGCATLPTAPTVDDALALAKAGASPDSIILRMQQSRATYRLSASDILRLHAEGMPSPVLDYMQQTQIESVRDDERFKQWDRRGPLPWPVYCGRYRWC